MKKILIIFFLLLSVLGYTQTVTPVLYPQYMEGVGNGVVSDLRSVPYACRMTLDGLIPNRLYYYYNRFVLDPTNANPDPNGQGTIIIPQSGATPFQRITAPNLSASSTAGTFTTDANGSYTGWFITEPTASPVYFPGNQVYWRIMLRNDQFAPANAIELRLTVPLPVRTLQWLGYAPAGPTPPAGFVGTLVTRAATATDFTPKNFVMLYDNVAGTGRPIGGTFVEDDLLSVTGLGYIGAYPNGTGAAQNGRWGAIVPSGTPQGPGLASGIRNISQFNFASGSLVNVCNGNGTGTFGTINTVNHAGTQATGAGVLNITTCSTAVVSCNNLSLSTVVTGTACNASTGAIDLTVSGGTAPYTYLWSNGATTQDISGVPGGNYTVTVTDATNVCTSVAAATVSTTQLISLSAVITGASACVNNSGAIDLTVNGGVGPYTYAWSNSATTEDLTGLTAGTYTVTVTGAGSCTASASYIVSQPAALAATASAPAIPNCGTTTTVLVSATGGNAPYTGTGSFNVTAGTYNYTVTDARGCTATRSITIAPALCINVAEVIYPKFLQGVGTGSPSSDLKVPYASRMTLTGLNANATYRFFTSFTDNPASNNNGALGAMILANQTSDFTRITSTSVATAGEYGEFTTDASGSYTGWYVLEPGSDIIFTPGNALYWRIMLNDGSGGTIITTRVTATNSVTVINWGFTSGAPLEGSAIYNVANTAWTPKNFVMLYDNITGTGRPVTGTFIESDGTVNTTAEGYDLWYEFFVNGFDNVWGTIIPNNLNNGINNISQYALSDGSFVNKCTSPDGVYGTTDTRNASTGNDAFGTLLIIDCTPSAGCSLAATTVVTNVLCFGASTGAVNLTVTGATAPTFAWTGPNGFTATTEDISGLIAGVYNVTITDGSCTATASATVTQPASAVTASAVATNVNCFGQSTGSVNLTVSGGTSPYTYLWSNSATTEDISGLAAGTYSVTVTDANGCTATASATVTQPVSAVSATAVATYATCGNANGSIDLTVSGGTSPYTYLWSNSATTEDINGLIAGTYSVTVTDANGCTASASATVNNAGAPTVVVTNTTNVLCFGQATGSINITVSGGAAPYTYLWSNNATTEDISGLAAGTYSVTVTDANGCTATASATVTQPASAVTASAVATNINCFGQSTGSVNLTVSGGTSPYTYLWSNSATTEDISGLAAGTYSVTVTDANGCIATASATVTQPASAVTASAVATNVNCFGQSTGSVNLTVSGGTSPYTYLWSNNATTEDISGLAAGTYSVTVTDANGCTATASATVTQPASAVTASAVATNATCGNANGSVNLTVSGGTAPYSYLWSNNATTEDISGLIAGTYSVTVTDANGCTASASATVNNVGGPSVVVTNTTNVLCFGQATGSINITVSGGAAPYTYLWSNGATTEDISGLIAGTYTVTVMDANECSATGSVTITQPNAALVGSAVASNATCGNANGSVNLTVTGGTAPYSYLWSNSATTEDISGLVPGTYSVTVTDANGCTATASATVNNIAGPSATVVATNATCGNANGSVNLTVTGGTAPYSYLWSNAATTEDISGLVAGTYSVTVTDANGCTATASATVNNIAGPSATAVATNATCGNASGSVDLTVTGGTAPYSYLWSNNATTEDISGLVAGTYSVTVTDANGCIATASATVNNAGAPSVVVTGTTNVLCFGQATGSINITVSGGSVPYTFLWSNGATTEDISGLIAGTYSVTVTDANGCSATASATITQPTAALSASAVGVGLTCSTTGNNGTITLTVSGGTSPYTYLWSNNATTQNLASLAAGTYTVTVTDANGCTATASATIRARFAASSSVGPLACTAVTGQVTVTPTGGTAPYTATATTSGVTPASQSGSGAMVFTVQFGAYSFNVVDATGCVRVVTGRVAGPLVAAASAGTIPCGQTTTIVTVSASQGIPPYSGTGNFTVPAGPYSFTVTDSRGCTATISGTIAAPLCYTVAEVYYPKYVQGVGTGSPSADTKVPFASRMTISGLTAGATYRYFSRFVENPSSALSNGIGDFILVNQVGNFSRVTSASMSTAGEYGEFTANGSGSYTGWFVQEPGSDIGFTPGNQLYWRVMLNDGAGGNTVAARVTASNPVTVLNFGSTPSDGTGLRRTTNVDYTAKNFVMLYNNIAGTGRPEAGTFIESDGTDNSVANGYADFYANSVNGVDKTWGTIIPNNLSNGINNISQYSLVNGSFVNACTSPDGVFGGTTDTKNANGGLTELVIDACNAPCNIVLTFTQTNVSCFGGSNGSATVTAANTNGGVSYLWSNGQTTATATGLIAGTYTVTVMDANECSATGSVTITQPNAVLVASSTATIIACNGGSSTVTVSAMGGTAPYTGTGTFTRTAGTYSFTVTDANGCTSVTSITIEQPAILVASSSATAIECNGGSSTVTVTATGGTAPYTGTGSFTRTAGTYSFTVTDANGCTAVTTITIEQPAVLVASSSATAILCNGGSSTVTVSATGGTAPYTGTGSFTRTAGTYSFTVTDANGCTAVTTITIAQPAVLVASSSATLIACNGGSSAVTISATGGTAPYTGTGTFSRTAGTYSFTVTDANGCTAVTTITIEQPAEALVASSTATVINCNGGSSTVTVSATGGTAPYTGTGTFTRTAGTYSFTVTDANGCTAVTTITIAQPAALVASSSATVIACNGGSSTVTVSATGGTAPYTGTGSFTRTAGTYNFTVTDANGCTSVTTITIVQPAVLVASSSATAIACNGGSSTVTVSATGGTAPYTGTGSFTRTAGTYSFTVTDANGCASVTTITITQPSAALVASSSATTILCNGGSSTVTVSATGGTAPYTGTGTFSRTAGTYSFTVTDAKGCTSVTTITIGQPAVLVASSSATVIPCNGASSTVTVSATGGTAPYTGTGTFTRGAGTWSFTVTDAAGCSKVTTVTIATPNCGPVDPNKCYKLVVRSTGKVAEVIQCHTGNGTQLTEKMWNNTTCQIYKFVSDGSGYYIIIPQHATNKVIGVKQCSNSDNKAIELQSPAGTDCQKWSITALGNYFIIKNKQSGLVWDAEGNITQRKQNNAYDQQWSIVEVGCPALPFTAPAGGCDVTVYPNPTADYFNLIIRTTDKITPVSVRILDVNGVVKAVYSNVEVIKTGVLRVGDLKWPGGTYFAEVIQGTDRTTVKMIKLN